MDMEQVLAVAGTVAEILVAVVLTPKLTYITVALTDIRRQTRLTNGRVNEHDRRFAALEEWKDIHHESWTRQQEIDTRQREADSRQREADERLRERAKEQILRRSSHES